MIAIITTSNFEYEKYISSKGLTKKNAKKIQRLSDVIPTDRYTEIVKIEGSQNVCDYVVNSIRFWE